MNKVVIRFLLQGSQFFQCVMDEAKATAIVAKWRGGEYKLNGPRMIGESSPSQLAWAVDTEAVVAVHTLPMEALQQQQAPASPPYHGGSGLIPQRGH